MKEGTWLLGGFDGFIHQEWPIIGIERFGADVRGPACFALRAGHRQNSNVSGPFINARGIQWALLMRAIKPPSPTPNAMPSVILHLGWAGTKVGVSSLTAHVKA